MKLKHFTDKQEGGLLAEYEKMFRKLRDEEIRYLEMGILKGGSIEWASKFFRKGLIFGMDNHIQKEAEDLMDVANFMVVDQSDSEGLKEYGGRFGEYDIVIDDGCHKRDLTENTFKCLWPFVKSGGWYIIEDWSAGYSHSPEHKQYAGMVELVAEIMVNRQKLGIGRLRIIYDKKSFAAFKKL